MKVAVLCEFSGVVRDAFLRHGHNAVSCDLLPSESPGPHIRGNLLDRDWSKFDLLICHPPCTHLAASGARHFWKKKSQQAEAVEFVRKMFNLGVRRVAVENPVGVLSSLFRKPDQTVQPWQFGHPEVKRTCFWLRGLPLLQPVNVVEGREARVHRLPPSPDRWKLRSRTYEGIAEAMASQWGKL